MPRSIRESSFVDPPPVRGTGQEHASRTRRVLSRLVRRPASRVGLVILATLVLGAAIGPVLAPQSPYLQDLDHRLVPPGDGHLLGTDEFGRDILSRLLYGTRISLTIGMVSVGIGLLAGGLLGLVTGYLGGRVDMIGMRVVDVLLAFPGILLAVVIVAILGPSLTNAMIAVGIVGVPHFARLLRGAVLSVKSQPFVEAQVAMGVPRGRILFRTILPPCVAPLMVQTSLGLASAILEAAGLSFLGLGAQPPTPEWGAMLGQGRDLVIHAPWVLAMPGIAILLSVLGFNLVGDGIRDALDPALEGIFGPERGRGLWTKGRQL